MSVRAGAVAALVVATSCVGCTKPGARTSLAGNAPDAAVTAAGPDAVALAGDRLIFAAKLLSTGEVLGASPFALFRGRPEPDAVLHEIPMPPGRTVSRICAAGGADVAGIVAEDGTFLVLRGGRLEVLADDAYTCGLSDDGTVVELRSRFGKLSFVSVATGKVLRHIAEGGGEGLNADYAASFSKDARWALTKGAILSTTGGLPDVDAEGEAAGFVGEEAVFLEPRVVSLVTPTTRARRTTKVCDGTMLLDRLVPRVVVACVDRVDVVALPELTTRTFTVPGTRGSYFRVLPSRDGDLLHAEVRRDEPTDPGHWFALDAASRKAAPEGAPLDVRGYDGTPGVMGRSEIRECWPCGASADHTRFVVPPRYSGHELRIFDAKGETVARWGSLGADSGVRYRDRGLDVSWSAKTGRREMLRLGPPAARGEGDAGAPARAPRRDVCPWEPQEGHHLTLASGELWWSEESRKACLCTAESCALPPGGPFVMPVDARPGVVLGLATGAAVSQIHVLDERFASSGVVMVDGACVDGRIHESGRGVTALCFEDALDAGARQREDTYASRAVLVDVDAASGKRTRITRTTLRPGRHRLVGAGDRAALLASDHPMSGRWYDVVELGTGRIVVHVVTGAEAAVATFADGTAEIFGDEKVATDALRCASASALAPFSSCRHERSVHGKLAFDL